MLFVQFYLDEYRYVLSTEDVIEIIPSVKLTHVPNIPEYVSGLCNYRGDSVPVVDLCQLFINRACARKLSTRIIFLEMKSDTGNKKVIGLMVEKATETIKIDASSFLDAGINSEDRPLVGKVVANDLGFITRVLPDVIISKIDQKLLFSAE